MKKDKLAIYTKHILQILFIFSVICSCAFIISKFNPSIGEDEPFTMGLIHHSYFRLIYIDSLDVHPPLYYVFLKTFLLITTFWTKSILVKIMFAKVLSLLFLIITLIALFNLMKIMRIDVNYILVTLTYLSILSVINFSLQIRMYEMALAFLSIEFVNLVKFLKNDKNIYLFISVVSASAASYTHYFTAIFAGIFLLVFMFKAIKRHSIHDSLKILFSGVIFLLLFIPCIKFAYKQVLHTSSSGYYNDANPLPIAVIESISGINFHGLFSILFGLVIVLFTIYLTIFIFIHTSSKLKPLFIDLINVFLISIMIPIIFSLLSHQIMDGRYFYPLVSIYEFLLICFVLNYVKFNNVSLRIYFTIILIMCVLPVGVLGKMYGQIHTNDLSSIRSYKYVRHIRHLSGRCIINGKKNNITQESVYMENFYHIHKPSVRHLRISQYVGSNDKTLINDVFSNMNINN